MKSADILDPTPANLELLTEHFRAGHIAAIPTETVYGLAGSVFDEEALTAIFKTKERPTFDPLIAHVGRVQNLDELVTLGLVDPTRLTQERKIQIEKLMRQFWPGPMTLVLPKSKRVPDLMTSGLSHVAIRSPSHPIALDLLERLGTPLAAPSANRFGRISPTSAQDVFSELGERIDFILDGGACEIGIESTILHMGTEKPTLLRPGKISIEDLESVLREPVLRNLISEGEKSAPAPGMLLSHYSPRAKLMLIPFGGFERIPQKSPIPRSIILFFKLGRDISRIESADFKSIVELTESASLSEAAQNLFKTLRKLDESQNSKQHLIFCESLPENVSETGLGFAIMDRLKRAAGTASS